MKDITYRLVFPAPRERGPRPPSCCRPRWSRSGRRRPRGRRRGRSSRYRCRAGRGPWPTSRRGRPRWREKDGGARWRSESFFLFHTFIRGETFVLYEFFFFFFCAGGGGGGGAKRWGGSCNCVVFCFFPSPLFPSLETGRAQKKMKKKKKKTHTVVWTSSAVATLTSRSSRGFLAARVRVPWSNPGVPGSKTSASSDKSGRSMAASCCGWSLSSPAASPVLLLLFFLSSSAAVIQKG